MKFKKTFILICLVVCLFAMASVCASDANDTAISSEDTGEIELSQDSEIEQADDNLQTDEELMAQANNEEPIIENDNATLQDKLAESEGTYYDLRDEIGDGGDKNLTRSYYHYTGGGTIEIINSGVINGNGAVIDMEGSNIRAFYVSASDVTIKNLTIKNANFYGNGGAISFYSSGTVENCNFTGNSVTGHGGAMYGGSAVNCTFTGNSAGGWGGAFCDGYSAVNCTFISNSAKYAGAISGSGFSVVNCTFISNSARQDGGAICMSGSIENCNFTNNTADKTGAVNFLDEGTATNCNFYGNKATGFDGKGGAVYFSSSGSAINCTFTNNTATYPAGGAVYFCSSGSVINCTFSDNSASNAGAIWFDNGGTVINCNFTGNKATGYNSMGGAISMDLGNVTNCNFANNSACTGGAVYFRSNGIATNCNFSGNKATGSSSMGGAIFMNLGSVINCYFVNNYATNGAGAVSSIQQGTVVDACIFKTESDTTFNTQNIPPILNVDNFTTFYGSGEKLTIDLRTNSSIPITNGNISISVYFKDNNSWVGNYSCLSGEGWTADLPVGSYYAIFDTEYAEFKPINRTMTITIPAIQYYVNLTSVTTNNRTVNITAESNIPENLFWDAKLLFVLPNNENIVANYALNGTWWALHTFDYYDVHEVRASYTGLDNVTINKGTITINRGNATITLDNLVLNYGDSIKVNVTTDGALAIMALIDGEATAVIDYAIPISGLNAGKHTLTVTAIPDYDHITVTKTVNVTVNRVDSTLTVDNMAFDYKGIGSTAVSYAGATGVTASVAGHDEAIVNVDGNTIAVSNLTAGIYNLTVTAMADANHNNVTKTATITVNKTKTQLTANAVAATYNINKNLIITLKDSHGNALNGVKVSVNINGAKTYTTDKNGQVKINVASLIPKEYAAKISFKGNANYKDSTKSVKVTVKKDNTKLIASSKSFTLKATKKVTATLKDSKNRIIKNRYVTFKVAGKAYKVKTDSKGVATAIVKLTKKGSFSTAVSFAGDAYYNKCSKSIKITVK